MEMTSSAQRKLADSNRRAHVEDLLRRYPNVGEAEKAEILRFLKKGPASELGLMAVDEQLKIRIQQFRHDHSDQFAIGWREYAILALVIITVVGLCVLLWDSGLKS